MTIVDNPWRSLEQEPTPGESGHFSRLYRNGHPGIVRFRWRLPERIRGLEFNVPSAAIPSTLRFPSAAGFHTTVSSARQGSVVLSTILLEASETRYNEIFESITNDLLSLSAPESETSGIARLAGRLESWAAFFRNGGSNIPSESAQLGLLAELWIMRDFLVPLWGPEMAVRAWMGPLGRPQDFQGRVAIEVKATKGPVAGKISISGARQLDDALTGRRLYLAVCFAERVAEDGDNLLDALQALRQLLSPVSFDTLCERVIAIGIDPSSIKADTAFVFKQTSWRFYAVTNGFPRILESDLVPGVLAVSYDVSLPACEAFRIDVARINDEWGVEA